MTQTCRNAEKRGRKRDESICGDASESVQLLTNLKMPKLLVTLSHRLKPTLPTLHMGPQLIAIASESTPFIVIDEETFENPPFPPKVTLLSHVYVLSRHLCLCQFRSELTTTNSHASRWTQRGWYNQATIPGKTSSILPTIE